MGRNPPKGLNLSQIVNLGCNKGVKKQAGFARAYLVNGVEVTLHAFDCHVLARLNALGLEYL